MKSAGTAVVGLLFIGIGFAIAYLLGFRCYTVSDFMQELSNFTHIPIAGKSPGTKVTAQCPDFTGFPRKQA